MAASAVHLPVLLDEVMANLDLKEGQVAVDATLGGGGYSAALAQAVGPGGLVVAIDRDEQAVRRGRERFSGTSQVKVVEGDFRDIARVAGEAGVALAGADAVVFDLGISSQQLDDPPRGFSFQIDAPLDMRMSAGQSLTAAEIVNQWPERRIEEVLRAGGEARWARRIARRLVLTRQRQPLRTTRELSALVGAAVPRAAWPRHIDVATVTFQALRMAVNDELEALRRALPQAISLLRPGGRIGVVSFHSLEDGAAKVALNVAATDCICPPRQPVCTCAHRASIRILTRRPLRPSDAEVARNPRARSGRLRVAERLVA